jgi:hypothetical protein
MARYKATVTLTVIASTDADALRKVHEAVDIEKWVGKLHVKAEEMDREMIAGEIRAAAEAKGMDSDDIDQDWMDVMVDLLVDAST